MGERVFMLVDVDEGTGAVNASCAAVCEKCMVLDPAQTMRVYLATAQRASRATELGVNQYVCHRNGTEVHLSRGADIGRLSRLGWTGRVDYCEAGDALYRWHR